jgi:hypothetical protein
MNISMPCSGFYIPHFFCYSLVLPMWDLEHCASCSSRHTHTKLNHWDLFGSLSFPFPLLHNHN